MPVEFFEGLLQRHTVEAVLRTIPERQLSYYRGFENIRTFLAAPVVGQAQITQLFTYASFEAFLAVYGLTGRFFQTGEDIAQLIDTVAMGLVAQNVSYAELTVSANEYVANTPLSLADVVDAMERGCEVARPVRLRWILDLVRDYGPQHGRELLLQILAQNPRHLVGITVGGSEDAYPTSHFADAYTVAREHGLGLSIHAGEWLGPQSVWDALRSLSPDRIGHGVRAIEDPALVEHLANHQIPLEVSLTSNLRTGVYAIYAAHPVRRLYEAGVPITINTDDPTFFGTTLLEEYGHLEPLGFSHDEILGLVENSYAYAFDRDAALPAG